MNYKIEAVILKSRDIKECDRTYSVFSKELGKISVLAVGVRKPIAKLASGLEPITRSEIFLVKGRWMDKATGVIIADQYPNIRKDEQRLWQILPVLNILDVVANEKEKNEQIFDDLTFFLGATNRKSFFPDKIGLLKLGLIWKIIVWLGYSPNLQKCRTCQNQLSAEKKMFFAIPGGIICEDCWKSEKTRRPLENYFPIGKNSVKILRIFLRNNYSAVERIVAKKNDILELEKATKRILESLLERKISI